MRGGERIGRLRWSLTCNSQFRHNSRNLRIRGATISSVVSSPEPKFSTVTPDLEALRTWLNDMIASLHFAQLVVLIIGLIARMRDLNLELRKQLLDVRRARPKSETLARVQQQYAFVFAPTGGESPRKPRAGKKPKEKKSRVGVHPGRATLPAHLERIEVMNPVPPELRRCTVCGSEMSTVGHSECEILDIIPARVVVLVRKDERVACPHDDCIVSAPTPPQLIDRGKLGLRLVVECLADKVVEHQPIERLTRRLQRMGVDVAPHTVGRSVVRAMDLLGPIARLIEAKVKGPGVLGTDATGLPVLDRDAPNGIRLGTVWAWTNGPWVCLDYHADATHEGPKAFLGDDLARIVQCDGTSTLSFIERAGMLDNTLILLTSDNGASGEGGLEGTHNELLVLNGIARTSFEENRKFYDAWGSAETDNHYHAGWAMAGNAPFRYFKQTTHNGGTAVPMIAHWPKGIRAKGELRTQYHHIIDIAPTFLDAAQTPLPDVVDGVKQMPLDGVSMRYSFDNAKAPTHHPVQYYEMYGHRSIHDNGWKAVTLHGNRMPWVLGGTFDFDKDVWALYNVDDDPGEANDLAAKHPEKLAELKKKWEAEALKYNVYPLYDDIVARIGNVTSMGGAPRNTYTYYPPGAEFINESLSPPVKNRNHTITASMETDGKTDGVIVAAGGYYAGYTLYVKNNIVTYTFNAFDENYYTVKADKPLAAGKHEVTFVYEAVPAAAKGQQPTGKGTLMIDGVQVGQVTIGRTVPAMYSVSESFDVGVDNGGSVDRKAYTSPFRFSDTLNWVRFDLQ